MGGMLGHHQDFAASSQVNPFYVGGEFHPDWDRGEGWGPYYAVFTDPLFGNNYWRRNNGANPSYCPEMACDPPSNVIATVSGFASNTRIREGGIVDFLAVLNNRWKSQDCYAARDPLCTDFSKFAPICGEHKSALVWQTVAGRWPSSSFGYSPCALTTKNIVKYLYFDVDCKEDGAWAGFVADFLGTLLLWGPNGFNGGIPYTCDYDIVGGAGGSNLINYKLFGMGNFDSTISGYHPSNIKSRIHYTQPNFFNTQNLYNGNLYAIRPYTWAEVAANQTLKKVLSSPGNAYSSMGNITGLFYDNDHNGTYICHKTGPYFLRPELVANIARTRPSVEDTAELIFEVGGREIWGTSEICCERDGVPIWINRFDYSIGEEMDPDGPQPEGKYYAVDYACGPRRASEYYRDDNGIMCNNCYKYYCNERIGTAKPHLAIYPFNDNHSAQLKLNIAPSQWMIIAGSDTEVNYYNQGNAPLRVQNLTDQKATPYSWIVSEIDIIDGGSGYREGDYFYVDFDPNWFLPWVDGQIINIFPDRECCDPGCLDQRPISWSDKYGYVKRLGNDVVYQRVRVSEVDDEGKIISLEIVPWYKNPEWKPGKVYRDKDTGEPVWSGCQDLIKKKEDKTEFYVEYLRILCHPNSVRNPGKGYSVGDIITWDFPPEQKNTSFTIRDTWKGQKAKAVVVDVNEEGGILDWYISGSDRWKQYGLFNLADNAPCYQYAYNMQYFDGVNTTLERDDRGRYRFTGHTLCDLSYDGIGVPVRMTPTPEYSTITGDNGSILTSLSLSVIRVNCKTTAGLRINTWPFSLIELCKIDTSQENGCQVKYKDLWYYAKFPPYPQSYGGGLEIKINFGSERANNSVFGSTIKSGTIISRGAGYAYKEKKHETPNLPTKVPDIESVDLEGSLLDENDESYTTENDKELMAQGVGEVGTGAEINYFFKTIDRFPNPFVYRSREEANFPNRRSPNNQTYKIDINRYSYFPVSDVTVKTPGKGYKIGQRFDVWPIDKEEGIGGGLTDFWDADGGDNPDVDVNGSWYDGEFAQVDSKGYMTYIPNSVLPTSSRQPQCTLEIIKVDKEGGIESIKVIHGGMMFKPVWTTGVRHPDVVTFLDSSLGYGAIAESTINTNIKDENNFGSVSSFTFRGATVDELPDPYYPYSTLAGRKKIPTSSGYGRDYANPEHGYYWQLNNTSVGIDGCRLLAYYNWGLTYNASIQSTPINYFSNSEYETHEIIQGSRPTFVPMTTVCSFKECYHDLLNKTYPLYREYNSFGPYDSFDCDAVTIPFVSNDIFASSPPKTRYCVARRKFRKLKDGRTIRLQSKVYSASECDGDIEIDRTTGITIKGMGPPRLDTAGFPALVPNPQKAGTNIDITDSSTPYISDYVVVEYGMNLTLSTAGQFKTHIDHDKGRTVIIDDTEINS